MFDDNIGCRSGEFIINFEYIKTVFSLLIKSIDFATEKLFLRMVYGALQPHFPGPYQDFPKEKIKPIFYQNTLQSKAFKSFLWK